MKPFGDLETMARVNRFFGSWLSSSSEKTPLQWDLHDVASPTLESTSYEFMLESLLEVPSDRFDRWRTRSHERW
jgi:hypothetical protein